jgi:DNA (cytosine-5)-methyltransferase 1
MGLAYYNEIDPFAAAWLQRLINSGHIAPGIVDTRSIEDVKPDDLRGFTQCHFFAGIGVWSHALRLAGWPDDRPVWTGSCPCQPFSAAGKGDGFADERHLWPAFFHLIKERRPSAVFGEQVASKDGLAWLDLVHADLEGEGYTVGAADLCAAGIGAPHIRQRLYWVADADCEQRDGSRHLGQGRRSELADRRDVGGLADAISRGQQRARGSCEEKGLRIAECCLSGRVADAINAYQAEAFITAYLESI